MRLKNVYKMGIIFSLFFSVVPLLALIVANILAKFGDCGIIIEAIIPDCPLGDVIHSLFVVTWLTIMTLPLGLFFGFVFWLLYLSVRRR